jgi:hypothetical protein
MPTSQWGGAMSDGEFVTTVLDAFQQQFQRLNLGPVDYAVAVRWSQTDMPAAIPVRAIEAAAATCDPRKAQRFKLQWLCDDVTDAYDEWRRMMGPYRGLTNPNVLD